MASSAAGVAELNGTIFVDLLQNAVDEIGFRYPAYFSRYPLAVGPIGDFVRKHLQEPLFAESSPDELADVLQYGINYLASGGIPIRMSCEQDPIADLLLQSILDAHAANMARIPLHPRKAGPLNFFDVLCGRYTLSKISGCLCYALAGGTGRPLVLISATGVPFNVWLPLLNDPVIKARCLVVQGRGTPLFEGGSPQASDLWDDVADIQCVLEAEGFAEIDVVAWCNGSRVGVELARRLPNRVNSLMLVAPSFHGAVDSGDYSSPFEDSIPMVCEMLTRDPCRGRLLLAHLTQATSDGATAALADDPQERASVVLSRPPQALASDMTVPFAMLNSLRNCVERAGRDRQYDVCQSLAQVRCPVMLLTGTHDVVTNSRLARDLLKQSGCQSTQVTLRGAGHHPQWLQYPYFKYVLECLLEHAPPISTARLCVEHFAQGA